MGYQSIDHNDTPTTTGLPRGDDGDGLGDAHAPTKQPERMASKVCLVAVGVVMGCTMSVGVPARSIQNRSQVTSDLRLSVTGKSFQDSLPFEETALPTSWNPALPRHGLPLLGAPVTSSVHLLYHAHESAFGLLYDKGSMSPYSLDYFLINSGKNTQRLLPS